MKQLRWLSPLALTALAACGSQAMVVPSGYRYADAPPPMGLIEGPSVAPPANDIPESQRRAWLDAQRPRVEPVHVEREIVVDRRPVRYERDYDRYDRYDRRDGWYLPLSLSLGYWGGSRRRHGGWGLGWNSGWCW